MKNCKAPKLRSKPIQDFTLSIPLRSGALSTSENIDQQFVKQIEVEYATRYLQHLGIEANRKNIMMMLKTNPLTSCEILGQWNSGYELADTLNIYPVRKEKSFEKQLGEIQFARQQRMRELMDRRLSTELNTLQKFAQSIDEPFDKYYDLDGPKYARRKLRKLEMQAKSIQSKEALLKKLKKQEDFLQLLTFQKIKQYFVHPFSVGSGFASAQLPHNHDTIESPNFAFQPEKKLQSNVKEELKKPLNFTEADLERYLDRVREVIATKLIPIVTENHQFAKEVLTRQEYSIFVNSLSIP